jgi:hypothetical protein
VQEGALNEYLRLLDVVLVYPDGRGAVLLSEREADAVLALMWHSGHVANKAAPYLANLAYERHRLAVAGGTGDGQRLSPPKLQVGGQIADQQAGESLAPYVATRIP